MVIEQRRRSLGGGMEVGRVLPFAHRRMVGLDILLDHMGPLDIMRWLQAIVVEVQLR